MDQGEQGVRAILGVSGKRELPKFAFNFVILFEKFIC